VKKLIFFGTQDWAAELLERLVQDDFFDTALVVTQPDQPHGRKKILTPPPVKQTALRFGLHVVQPQKLRESSLINELKRIKADVSLIIAYGRMLPEKMISLPSFGTVNVHPSLLPRWRGPSPVQTAIANGDTVSGVTIMKIDAQMDHGPILAQKKIPIDPLETSETFMKKVIKVSAPLLLETLKQYVKGLIIPTEQNHSQATLCKMLTREDGRIDWNRPAQEIERMIRAYDPWPGAWTTLNRDNRILRVKILDSKIANVEFYGPIGTLFSTSGRLFASTANQPLEITSLQPEGKAPMLAQAFLSGYAEALGCVLR
jgi:methionyl-tRNA formyltransferase